MLSLSRLEIKDILANAGPGLDPDLRAKLLTEVDLPVQPGTTINGGVIGFPPGFRSIPEPGQPQFPPGAQRPVPPAPTPEPTQYTLHEGSPPKRAVLTPRLEAAGWTQEDIDAINAAADIAKAAQDRIDANYRPIVGEKNAANPNAAFAEPDIPNMPTPPQVKPGEKNQWGDECVKYDAAGEPVYACQRGHGYLFNRMVPGCPQCFAAGASGPARNDPNDIDGEEPF